MSLSLKYFRFCQPKLLYFRVRSNNSFCSNKAANNDGNKGDTKVSQKKDLLRKTPIGKLDEFEGRHPYQEKEPLPEFKDGVNPKTGEIGGPKGPEPTRYGDWERKGRVSDF